jgi:shikimate dehydrogenase
MRTFGLIGKTLIHSFSKTFFEKKFAKEAIVDVEYQLFELNAITDFEFLLATQPNLVGLNVTIPYKQAIIPFLDELSTAAKPLVL